MSGSQNSSFTNVLFDPMMARRQTQFDIDNQYAPQRNQLFLDEGAQKLEVGRQDLADRAANRQALKAYTDSLTISGAPAPGEAIAPFERQMGGAESSGNPSAVNAGGYSGRFQFGAERLKDLGIYTPAEGEDLKRNQWRGTFSIPGFAVSTHDDFLKNDAAQHAVFGAHVANIDAAIAATPGADKLDQNGLRAVAHLGGVGGMQRFVSSGGLYDPGDNPNAPGGGTHLSQYYKRFAAGGATALQQAFGSPHGPGGPQAPAAPGVAPAAPAAPAAPGAAPYAAPNGLAMSVAPPGAAPAAPANPAAPGAAPGPPATGAPPVAPPSGGVAGRIPGAVDVAGPGAPTATLPPGVGPLPAYGDNPNVAPITAQPVAIARDPAAATSPPTTDPAGTAPATAGKPAPAAPSPAQQRLQVNPRNGLTADQERSIGFAAHSPGMTQPVLAKMVEGYVKENEARAAQQFTQTHTTLEEQRQAEKTGYERAQDKEKARLAAIETNKKDTQQAFDNQRAAAKLQLERKADDRAAVVAGKPLQGNDKDTQNRNILIQGTKDNKTDSVEYASAFADYAGEHTGPDNTKWKPDMSPYKTPTGETYGGTKGRALGNAETTQAPMAPTAMNEAMLGNVNGIHNIDATLKELESHQWSVGVLGKLPQGLLMRTDPEGVKVRAMIAAISGQTFHDISGAAVSVSEAKRLSQYIPGSDDPPAAVAVKLKQMRAVYQEILTEHYKIYGPTNGMRALPGVESVLKGEGGGAKPDAKAPPAIGTVVRGHRFTGGDPSEPGSWVTAE